MENVRKFMLSLLGSKCNINEEFNPIFTASECVENITNKIFMYSEEDRKRYARMVLFYMASNGVLLERDGFTIDPDATFGNYSYFNELFKEYEYVRLFFLSSVIYSFYIFDINLEEIAKEAGIYDGFLIPNVPLANKIIAKSSTKALKGDKANQKNQYGILSALIKASGYTIPDGKKFASFISWLCGGSAESIRQNACCKYDCGDENILKEKFASIGITYEDGKIKKRIETANL